MRQSAAPPRTADWSATGLWTADRAGWRTLVGNVELSGGRGPTGVTVDANGRGWVANHGTDNAQRIDPAIGRVGAGGRPVGHVDLTIDLGAGASPYDYSDMAGIVTLGSTAPQGSWSVTQDSGTAGARWGPVSWNAEQQGQTPAGTSIEVQVRSADTAAGLASATFVGVDNGVEFDALGRFLEVRATLRTTTNDVTPVLSDIRIATAAASNTAPVAEPQEVTTDEDTPVEVLLTCQDEDGDELTCEVVTPPANGTLSGTAPALTCTPEVDCSGEDSFTFVARMPQVPPSRRRTPPPSRCATSPPRSWRRVPDQPSGACRWRWPAP